MRYPTVEEVLSETKDIMSPSYPVDEIKVGEQKIVVPPGATTSSQDWAVTLPQDTEWADYQKELDTVKNGKERMNYRLPYKPSAKPGEKCFLVWRGKVRGWMEIVGVQHHPEGFTCSTSGAQWPPGWYLQRSGEFHPVEGLDMKGFRGIKRI
jgi:hypothetical protein